MYAVSGEGIGLVAGTMAYSRRDAILKFLGSEFIAEWGEFKSSGYRTVECCVEWYNRGQRYRRARKA